MSQHLEHNKNKSIGLPITCLVLVWVNSGKNDKPKLLRWTNNRNIVYLTSKKKVVARETVKHEPQMQ